MTDAYFYDADGRDRVLPIEDIDLSALRDRQLLWVDAMRTDNDLGQVLARVGPAQDSLSLILDRLAHWRIAMLDKAFHFSVPMPPGKCADGTRLDFVVGANWIVTVRDCDIPFLTAFRDEDRGESFKGKLTATAMCASFLDRHIEMFQSEISEIMQATDKIDEGILGDRRTRPPLDELAKMRQRVGRLRDKLGAHREIIHGLLRPDFINVTDGDAYEYFAMIERHFDRTEDGLDRARETVVGSLELYATRTAQDTNEMVSVLTIITVIIGAAGAIAGVFGMNFDTAFSHWGATGFYIATASMVAVALFIVVLARRRKWI